MLTQQQIKDFMESEMAKARKRFIPIRKNIRDCGEFIEWDVEHRGVNGLARVRKARFESCEYGETVALILLAEDEAIRANLPLPVDRALDQPQHHQRREGD